MKYILIINFFFLTIFCLKAEQYIFESSSNVNNDHINISKKLKYTIVKIESRWTDSLGEYGSSKCNGYDNNNDKFQINLKKNSIEDAGSGKVIYISGKGRYLNFIKKEFTYAVNYINPKARFYEQICKDYPHYLDFS